MLEGKGFIIPGYTASQHNLVGKKLDKGRIIKWKKELTIDDILIIESKCKPVMSVFGYEVSQNINYKIGAKKKVKMLLGEILYYLKNKMKKKRREYKA